MDKEKNVQNNSGTKCSNPENGTGHGRTVERKGEIGGNKYINTIGSTNKNTNIKFRSFKQDNSSFRRIIIKK